MNETFRPWIVVPVFDHEHAIGTTVAQLLPHGVPILLVDDGSRRAVVLPSHQQNTTGNRHSRNGNRPSTR